MRDHKQYVGGNWKQVQEFQLDFIKNSPEFSPDKTFLDLGCGSMRLGSALIPELNEGRYIGLDFNEEIVKIGIEKEIDPQIIEEKKPTFIFNSEFNLSEIEGKIDFAWVYQVFIHVSDTLVEAAMNNVANKLADDGVVYATFTEIQKGKIVNDNYVYDSNQWTFHRPVERIEEFFNKAGLKVEQIGNIPKSGIIFKGTKL